MKTTIRKPRPKLEPVTITVRNQATLRRLHKAGEILGMSPKRAAAWQVGSGSAETIRLAEEWAEEEAANAARGAGRKAGTK